MTAVPTVLSSTVRTMPPSVVGRSHAHTNPVDHPIAVPARPLSARKQRLQLTEPPVTGSARPLST